MDQEKEQHQAQVRGSSLRRRSKKSGTDKDLSKRNESTQQPPADLDGESALEGEEEDEGEEEGEEEEEQHPTGPTGRKEEKRKSATESIAKPAPDLKKSGGHGKSRSETDPLMMSLPELTKLLQAKAAKRKARVAQRQRAALLGFLPPGVLPPAKLNARQAQASESVPGVEASRESGFKSQPSIGAGPSRSTVQKTPKLRRKSLLEHMERQMELRGQNSILFRMVIIGSHEQKPSEILDYTEKRIKEFNVAPELELLTGLLIVYPKHVFHVLEGSEMALADYISDAAYEFEKKPNIPNLEEGDKVMNVHMIILGTFQIDERFMRKWQGVTTPYPTHMNLMEISGYQKRLFELIKRAWILLIVGRNFISLLPPTQDAPEDTNAGRQSQTMDPTPSKADAKPMASAKPTESDFGLGISVATFVPVVSDNINDSINEVMEESMGLLPSLPILQYFLKDKERCPKLLTPQQHIDKYWGISNEPSWRDTVWPIPSRLYPYD